VWPYGLKKPVPVRQEKMQMEAQTKRRMRMMKMGLAVRQMPVFGMAYDPSVLLRPEKA
jgi:hypothetical protein